MGLERLQVWCRGTRESSKLKSHDFSYFCRYTRDVTALYRRRVRMAHFTLTRSVSEDWCCLLAYAAGECQLQPRAV